MNIKELATVLKRYEELMLNNNSDTFSDDYTHGVYNGIEIVLALLEDRPAFYRSKDKQPQKYDVEKYPEHFL